MAVAITTWFDRWSRVQTNSKNAEEEENKTGKRVFFLKKNIKMIKGKKEGIEKYMSWITE